MDGVSSASAVLAVGSAAVKLAEGIKKLHDFWKEVQGAPAHITSLFHEFDSLAAILARCRYVSEVAESDEPSEHVLRECEKNVGHLLNKLRKPMLELKSSCNTKRTWSALKITLKKKEIEALRASVETAKLTLILIKVNQILSQSQIQGQSLLELTQAIANSRLQFSSDVTNIHSIKNHITMQIEEIIVDNLPSSDPQYSKAPSRVLNSGMNFEGDIGPRSPIDPPRLRRVKNSPLTQRSSAYIAAPVASIYAHFSTRKVPQDLSNKDRLMVERASSYVLYPGTVLKMFGINHGLMLDTKSTTGWQFSLQPFNALPFEAPIFEFCRNGNVAAIQTLLSGGHASLWDRDPLGCTPLWIASESLHLETAKFLLDQGADPKICAWGSKGPALTAVKWSTAIDVKSKILMLDLLLNHTSAEYDNETITNLVAMLLLFYRPQKMFVLTMAERRSSAVQILKLILPMFPPDDVFCSLVVCALLQFFYDQEALHWALQYIKGAFQEDKFSILHEALANKLLLGDRISIEIIVQKTTNLHRVWDKERTWQGGRSIESNTPTSLAMYQPEMFVTWKSILLTLGHDLGDFIKDEIGQTSVLTSQGWTEHTLGVLFSYPFNMSVLDRGAAYYYYCRRCRRNESRWLHVDLEWRRMLRAIRLGQTPATFESEIFPSNVGITALDFERDGLSVHSCSPDLEYVSNTKDPPVQYRYVCSDHCWGDRICVSDAYENDSVDEPYLPPYEYKSSKVELVQISSDIDDRIKRMPGSFEE